MSSGRSRVFDDVLAELLAIPSPNTPKHGAKDLRGFNQLTGDKFPAVFVVPASGGTIQGHPGRHLREEMLFTIVGYILGQTETPDGVSDARETFFQAVLNATLGTGLQDRLQKSLAANGNSGAILIEHSTGPDTDEGQAPPFGFFILPMRAVLHYTRGAL